MAKITKGKLVKLIQESLEEYMEMGESPPESPCAAEEEEPMELEDQVAELKDMMQQLMDMMGGGQEMAEDLGAMKSALGQLRKGGPMGAPAEKEAGGALQMLNKLAKEHDLTKEEWIELVSQVAQMLPSAGEQVKESKRRSRRVRRSKK